MNDVQPKTREAPIHPLSALLLIVIDNLWTLADWAAILWLITIPLSFLAVFLPTYFIQKFMRGDSMGRALAISSFLGVLAAVPTPITGTTVGTLALAFAGFNFLKSKRHAS